MKAATTASRMKTEEKKNIIDVDSVVIADAAAAAFVVECEEELTGRLVGMGTLELLVIINSLHQAQN